MKNVCPHIINFLLFFYLSQSAKAQLEVSGQLRTRTEFRDGQGTLRLKGTSPSFFTSQRSRLSVNYKINHIVLRTAIQDVRLWGQDASTINNADGNKLSLHEGWAEIQLADKKDTSFRHSAIDYFAIKIGRQELIYDDSRLLGNLDWLQQARRHDAVVLKFLNKGWQVDVGAAFNQNTDAVGYNGTYYTPANVPPYIKDSRGNLAPTPAGFIPLSNIAGLSSKNGSPAVQTIASSNGLYQNYRALQYAYLAKSFRQTKLTGLFVADHFGKYRADSVRNIAGIDTGYIYGKHFDQMGLNSRVTSGLFVTTFFGAKKAFGLTAAFYYQCGRDKDGQKLDAYTSTVSLLFTKSRFGFSTGWDYLAGDDAFSTSAVSHRFDPLYGTPHRFWGLMDYFYVATGSPTGGLSDPFAKIKYTGHNKRLSAEVSYHCFSLAKNQKDKDGKAVKKYLGSEVDIVTDYSLNKATTIEYGFSLMAASKSMEYAKGVIPGTSHLTALWTYFMVTVKPEFIFK